MASEPLEFIDAHSTVGTGHLSPGSSVLGGVSSHARLEDLREGSTSTDPGGMVVSAPKTSKVASTMVINHRPG